MRQQSGVVIGIVKSVNPGDGTVQLEFPWLNQSLRSAPAPVAMPMTGNGRGMFFMPEENDEALVAFEQGNFDHPFVVGFLWNGVDKTPESTIKNRIICTPGGHTLRFEDTDNAKKIILKSSRGHEIEIDDQANKITVSDSGNGNQVVISSQSGEIKIKAASKVTVQAPTVSVDSPNIELGQIANFSAVLGELLQNYLTACNTVFATHMHVGELAAGFIPVTPTPPAAMMPPAQGFLSTTVKEQ